jgi:hypothetical protein
MSQIKKAHALCAASLLALASTASAQSEGTATTLPAPQEMVLNAGVPITLAVAEEVNSSTHKEGDLFKLTVINDVVSGGQLLFRAVRQRQAKSRGARARVRSANLENSNSRCVRSTLAANRSLLPVNIARKVKETPLL